MIKFPCTHCTKLLGAEDKQAGMITTCPKCKEKTRIPGGKAGAASAKPGAPPAKGAPPKPAPKIKQAERLEVVDETEEWEVVEDVEAVEAVEEAEEVVEAAAVDLGAFEQKEDRPRPKPR